MRLLNVHTLRLIDFPNDQSPPYVIASHRWQEEEVAYKEFRTGLKKHKKGYKKIKAFANFIRENVPSVKWLWIDTCCINRDSAAELSEAVNMMFNWYRNAEVCIAYLNDVNTAQDHISFGESEWFKRGWTLQELLAPPLVVFVTRTWQVIGNKGALFHGHGSMAMGPGMEELISARTGVPTPLLLTYTREWGPSIDGALEWMRGRQTTREEDMSYALYGILGIAPGTNYGEGGSMAKRRLLAALEEKYSSGPEWVSAWRTVDFQTVALRTALIGASSPWPSSSAQPPRLPPVEPRPSQPPSKARDIILKIVLQIQVCHVFLLAAFLIVGGSLALGLYYTIAKDRMGDGFTAAGWITAVGTMLLAAPMAKHYPHCKCWTRSSDRMLP